MAAEAKAEADLATVEVATEMAEVATEMAEVMTEMAEVATEMAEAVEAVEAVEEAVGLVSGGRASFGQCTVHCTSPRCDTRGHRPALLCRWYGRSQRVGSSHC